MCISGEITLNCELSFFGVLDYEGQQNMNVSQPLE